ncbi:hypothetical protein RI129_005113 [Pyrocoelia pectoralis]|uniref:Cilia- and flagella-associated protein 47 domain-containing protein n=1 Tax=Pyrocoelia pectoralis TaxID=417401 RepID=A0AAN7VM52_9COLE
MYYLLLQAFKIKSLLRGQKLGTGLTIQRYVKFQSLCASSVPAATLPIFINEERINYKIRVILCSVKITAEPTTLHFDLINAGHSAAVRMLSVRNDGSKSARFNIDLGRNEMEFIVEPSKGILQASIFINTTTTFRVECLSTLEGQFAREFWIKCETPLRIGMMGKIIRSQLHAIHENALRHFTLIDFPKTYAGTCTSKLFLIKNFSSMPGIYCILAEINDEVMDLCTAVKDHAEFRNFRIKQVEGIMESFESRIVEVSIPFAISFYLYFTDKSNISLMVDESSEKLEDCSSNCPSNIIRILLFGESVTPNVSVRPNAFDLQRIKIQTIITRELLLSNNSEDLPIIFSYTKKACIEIQPKLVTLKPSEKLEVCLSINPTKIGMQSITIVFDLLFYNRPNKNGKYVKVGEVKVPVKWEVVSEAIHPKSVAPKSFEPTWATIENGSNTDIIVKARCGKTSISFPNGDKILVKSTKKEKVKILFHAGPLIGRYNAIVDFFINTSDTYSISVNAEIVPKCVKFSQFEINLNTQPITFVHISNPINVPVNFTWKLPESQFEIHPISATIPRRGNMICCISYKPNHLLPHSIDATLCSENGTRQIVNITREINNDPNVKLGNTVLQFDYIPLNLPLETTTALSNLESEPITFVVLNPQPIYGINISPTEGAIPPYGEQVFTINIKISTCISFENTVCIDVNTVKVVELQIVGRVLYPEIALKPETIKLQKIVAHSFDRQVLVIYNKSEVSTTIDFCLDAYVEYKIFDTRTVDITSIPITSINLLPRSHKQLYLHFNPMGAAVYCFYLPIIINGILGPVLLSAPETLSPLYFTKSKTDVYDNLNCVNIIAIPKKLPTSLVSTTVGCDTLKFTKMNVKFNYSPGSVYSETETEIQIWNASQDTCKFCIRTDHLTKPFFLQYLSGNSIELKQYSIVCELNPQEEVILKASFRPLFEGTYFIKLPIYLRNYSNGSVFNYLTMTGYYPKPVISADKQTIYFEPFGLTCQAQQNMKLLTEFHNNDCSISVITELSELKVQFGERRISQGSGEIDVTLICSAKTTTTIDGKMNFICSCGAQHILEVKGLIENSLPTNHAFYAAQHFENGSSELDTMVDVDAVSSSVSTAIADDDIMMNYNESSFPFFPSKVDDSDYAVHMRRVCIAIEEWISHQGLYGKKYYKIPEGIAALPELSADTEKKAEKGVKKKIPVPLKFIDLLVNLVGSTLLNYVTVRSLPDENLERINTMYNIYYQIIQFVIAQGGLLPHVSPEHLFMYGDYVTFYKDIYPNKSQFIGETVPKTLSVDEFYLLSKQSWIDLLLQSYKVFILSKVKFPTKYRQKSINTCDTESTSIQNHLINSCQSFENVQSSKCAQKIDDSSKAQSSTTYECLNDSHFWHSVVVMENSNFLQESEMILLYWLEYHFNNVIDTHWTEQVKHSNLPIVKKITNFDYDLRDGLALIAVTMSYCHYLVPLFSDIYITPTCEDHAFHNASRLLESWSIIKLSYTLLPMRITCPNCIQMLMLVNYLFDVLPSFSAHNILYFKTGLSTTCSKYIEVENSSSTIVCYKVIVLGNVRGLFEIAEDEIELAPSEKKKLKITFSARFLKEERIILILNGESCGKPHAKSMAFELVGQSELSYSTSVVTIPVPVYKVLKLDLPIQSPYTCAATFNINYSFQELVDETVGVIPASIIKNKKIPRAINCPDVALKFDDDGIGNYQITVCCITTNETSTWVIFTNSTIGNFTVNINIIPQIREELYYPVEVPLKLMFPKVNCSCRHGANVMNKGCPRRISIKIPCRNHFLWDAFGDLVLNMADEMELNFWKKYIGTTAGIEIQKWLMRNESNDNEYCAIKRIFDSTIKYSITMENSSPHIIVQGNVTICNVFSCEDQEIFIHIGDGEYSYSDIMIKLESMNSSEYRFYKISFMEEKRTLGRTN